MSEHNPETGDTLRGYVPPSLQDDGYDENDVYRGYVPPSIPVFPSAPTPATPSPEPEPAPDPGPEE